MFWLWLFFFFYTFKLNLCTPSKGLVTLMLCKGPWEERSEKGCRWDRSCVIAETKGERSSASTLVTLCTTRRKQTNRVNQPVFHNLQKQTTLFDVGNNKPCYICYICFWQPDSMSLKTYFNLSQLPFIRHSGSWADLLHMTSVRLHKWWILNPSLCLFFCQLSSISSIEIGKAFWKSEQI